MVLPRPRPRKRLGQHWLRDQRVLQRIVVAARVGPEDRLLEIGPGQGALTDHLLATPAAAVVAVELDHQLIAGLQQRFGADERFSLLQGDALELLRQPLACNPNKVVANIPYNITGPLLQRLMGSVAQPRQSNFQRLVLLMQKEVADRVTAPPGSPACGALSIRMQLLAAAQIVCTVPPACFSPPPEVTSAVVALTPYPPHQRPYAPEQAPLLEQLLRVAYTGRRKMLRKTLGGIWPMHSLKQAARQASIDLSQRPQDLNPHQWVALSQALALPLP
ncbi:MAG: 16S rRNA methyltransferase [Candidatus Synechococcus spongiarum SP3]|uniref:Ribosomal RNA small subunit methyltransferase A n=1 Tax=Candidatus Synechococcus spongiarum SP3 TaxID=1604020 RepID=A0A0G2HJM0_9SYNE|nr:MAG: 16S rRNA methyltransferase [Candidatus Synechococcus spongiarum SP3]